jgi:hypothetical protein
VEACLIKGIWARYVIEVTAAREITEVPCFTLGLKPFQC